MSECMPKLTMLWLAPSTITIAWKCHSTSELAEKTSRIRAACHRHHARTFAWCGCCYVVASRSLLAPCPTFIVPWNIKKSLHYIQAFQYLMEAEKLISVCQDFLSAYCSYKLNNQIVKDIEQQPTSRLKMVDWFYFNIPHAVVCLSMWNLIF